MKKLALFAFTLLSAWAMTAKTITGPVDYVSPLVGTQSKHALSTGNTYPAIALPWGMNFWVPQTGKMGDGWAYTYDADKIRGFKQTHQPSPWINDYGQFAIMPVTGKAVFNQDERASWFSHKAETATPYYYKVYLADHDVVTEIAPTERAAAFRFTFPENDHSYVVVDAFDKGSFVKVIPSENKIIGYTTKNSGGVPANFKNYFVLVFDKPFTYTAAVASGVIDTNKLEATDNHAGALIGFKTRKGEQVNVRVASSFISPEQAELNLKELGTDNVEQIAAKGRKIWNDVLGRIEVKDDDIDHLRTFYSCLYRSVLFPRSFYEIDAKGDVMHYSPYNGEVLPGYMFTDTGFWDTFRCLFPFLNLMYPSMNQKMQEEPKWKRTWHFIRPTVISVAVVLLAFFIMQGRPLATTLDRRTDLVSVVVTQNGAEQAFTDQDNIVRAAEVAGVLSRRFKTTQEHEPDTCYVFTFQNGRELKIGVYENDIYYDGQWYTGAASTPDLFRSMTGSRFFVIETTMPEMESTAE